MEVTPPITPPLAEDRTASTGVASVLYQLVASKLGGDPLQFIRERRTATPQQPFRIIAQELSTQAGVDVTYEAVRRWWRATPEGQQELASEEPLS